LRSIFANVKDLALASEASKENDSFLFEVIVVENGSQDGSLEMIEQEFPQVKLIKNNYNAGFTKGNNQGFRASRGEYILFLNSDTVIPSSSNSPKSVFELMVEKMTEDRSISMLTPKLIYPDGRFQDEYYRKLPSIIQTFWVYLFPFNKLTHNIKFLRRRYLSDVNPDKSGYIENFNVPGAAPIISREAYEKVGGRDENIFYWMEDIDLFWSMRKAGYKMFYLAEATIIHLGGMSNIMWDDLRKMLDFRQGYVYVFRKHKGKFQGFVVKWMFILNVLISAPFLLILGIFKRKFWKKGTAALKFSWKFLKV
jgi:GT2 family glycosyltransferase